MQNALWQPPLNEQSYFFSSLALHSPSLCTLSPFQGRGVAVWHFLGLSDYFRSTIIITTTLKKFKLAERKGAGDEDLGS